MQLNRLRQDAQASLDGNTAAFTAVAFREVFRDAGRPVAFGDRTDGELTPESVYLIRTGIGVKNVRHPSQLFVRSTYEMFSTFTIERVEVTSTDGEVIVFIRPRIRFSFKRMVNLFEVVQLSEHPVPTNAEDFPAVPEQPQPKTGVGEFKGFSLQGGRKELPVVALRAPAVAIVGPAGGPDTNPAAEKKVADWLASADIQPGQVATSDESRPPLSPTITPDQAVAAGPVDAKIPGQQ